MTDRGVSERHAGSGDLQRGVRPQRVSLAERFAPGDIVIDVGAHIGSFAEAVVSRGCRNVTCIEPDRSNFEIAAENLRPHIEAGCVELVEARRGGPTATRTTSALTAITRFQKSFPGMAGIINTGGGSVIWGGGEPVAKVAFDDIVDRVTNRGEHRVRLLKLDCEGAEWPNLLTSQRLHLISEICGEFHEIGGGFLEISEDRPAEGPVFSLGGTTSSRSTCWSAASSARGSPSPIAGT